MIRYFDGQFVELGDHVDFDGEPGTVVDIAEGTEQFTALGMEEPVVGFSTAQYPVTYQSPADLGWDGIVLVCRQA